MTNMLLRKLAVALTQTTPVTTPQSDRQPPKNPFMQANLTTAELSQVTGVNQPLRHPMFVGYRDNKPIYAGSRLFVLY